MMHVNPGKWTQETCIPSQEEPHQEVLRSTLCLYMERLKLFLVFDIEIPGWGLCL